MDRMARITPEELDKLYAAMPNRQGRQRSCYRCGTTRGLRRFGGGPFVCDAHKPSGQT